MYTNIDFVFISPLLLACGYDSGVVRVFDCETAAISVDLKNHRVRS